MSQTAQAAPLRRIGVQPPASAARPVPANMFKPVDSDHTDWASDTAPKSVITNPGYALEAMIVGGIIRNNDWMAVAASRLTENDFEHPITRNVFKVLCKILDTTDARVDVVGLAADSRLTGAATLENLIEIERLSAHLNEELFRSHIDRVGMLADERSLQRAARDVSIIAGNASMEVESRVASIVETVQKSVTARQTKLVDMRAATANVLDTMIERAQNPSKLVGLTTGFAELDALTLGLCPGDLIIVAGRPSMGKTALAMAMSKANLTQGGNVNFDSLEMQNPALLTRFIADETGISMQDIRRGSLTEEQWELVLAASERIQNWPLHLSDRPLMTCDAIVNTARDLKRDGMLNLVVVDYLQLVETAGGKETRTNELSSVSRALKLMAMDLEVPVIALSQLNRTLEHRPNKRPILSDLRESGAIEQDADVILFAYRDEVYNPDTADLGVAEIIIGKQRNGPLGTVRVRFDGVCAAYRDQANQVPLAPALAERIAGISVKERGNRGPRQRKSVF